MPRYLCLQRSLPPAPDSPPPSPAEMQEIYARFGAWKAQFEDNLVDLGGRLGEGRLVTEDGRSDGPFVEVKELVGGYMIVSADDLEGAIRIAAACPGVVGPRSGIEVVEIFVP